MGKVFQSVAAPQPTANSSNNTISQLYNECRGKCIPYYGDCASFSAYMIIIISVAGGIFIAIVIIVCVVVTVVRRSRQQKRSQHRPKMLPTSSMVDLTLDELLKRERERQESSTASPSQPISLVSSKKLAGNAAPAHYAERTKNADGMNNNSKNTTTSGRSRTTNVDNANNSTNQRTNKKSTPGANNGDTHNAAANMYPPPGGSAVNDDDEYLYVAEAGTGTPMAPRRPQPPIPGGDDGPVHHKSSDAGRPGLYMPMDKSGRGQTVGYKSSPASGTNYDNFR